MSWSAAQAAYAVFSAGSAKAELSLASEAERPVLVRLSDGCWCDGRCELRREAGRLLLSERGGRIFHEKRTNE